MFATKEELISLLKAYPALKKKICLLQYERSHPSQVSEQEVINGLALSHPLNNDGGQVGHISDKTMRIALSFQNETDRLNYESILEIDQELSVLTQRLEKLEFYVDQLEAEQAEIIRNYYFYGKSWSEIQEELNISSRTLLKRRNAGISALLAMGKYMEGVVSSPEV